MLTNQSCTRGLRVERPDEIDPTLTSVWWGHPAGRFSFTAGASDQNGREMVVVKIGRPPAHTT